MIASNQTNLLSTPFSSAPYADKPTPTEDPAAPTTPEDVLRQTFGYKSFRPHQREIVEAIISGRDVLAVMPTSAGKSICYQIPALMNDGLTIVVSPLISLMADQVGALRQAGVAANFLNSSLSYSSRDLVMQDVRQGYCQLLYVAPERLDDKRARAAFTARGVSLVAVDEAHCISQWGNDFRPSYQRINNFVASLQTRPPICALTATATRAVRRDIESSLGLCNPLRVIANFDRPNLSFELRRSRTQKEKLRQLITFLQDRRGKSGIIYCLARRGVEKLTCELERQGFKVTRYHAGLSVTERLRNQNDFLYDRTQIMVATNAFGMGIDKSNVSFVVHYNLPLSMEAYYQEAGRAGRDGTSATCMLLYSPIDVQAAEFLVSRTARSDLSEREASDLRAHDMRRLQDMVRYATSTGCLRHQLLAYFGQDAPETCNNCSNCLSTWEETDRTTEAMKVVSCVARLSQRHLSLGASTIISILRGSSEKRILQRKLDTLTTYGIMRSASVGDIYNIIDELVSRGILSRSEGAYPMIMLTPDSRPFLHAATKGQTHFIMRVVSAGKSANQECKRVTSSTSLESDVSAEQARNAKSTEQLPAEQKSFGASKETRDATQTKSADASEIDETLFECLRKVRTELAREQHVPPYIIFANATLEDMCRQRPHTRDEFLGVSGVGKVKAKRYGDRFLAAIASWDTNTYSATNAKTPDST